MPIPNSYSPLLCLGLLLCHCLQWAIFHSQCPSRCALSLKQLADFFMVVHTIFLHSSAGPYHMPNSFFFLMAKAALKICGLPFCSSIKPGSGVRLLVRNCRAIKNSELFFHEVAEIGPIFSTLLPSHIQPSARVSSLHTLGWPLQPDFELAY